VGGPSYLGDVPLGTLAALLGNSHGREGQGGVVASPISAKIVAKILRGEFIDLNTLLPHRLGMPELPLFLPLLEGIHQCWQFH
jgi:hypothetical protein